MKFLADENFDNTIIRGLERRQLDIEIVRVQDIGLSGKDDPTVLEWAAKEGRVLLTHDVATILAMPMIVLLQDKQCLELLKLLQMLLLAGSLKIFC